MILLGYGLPAVLAITLALIARTTRPLPYRVVAAITAVTLALFYLTLEVRRLFHGPNSGRTDQRRRAILLFDASGSSSASRSWRSAFSFARNRRGCSRLASSQ